MLGAKNQPNRPGGAGGAQERALRARNNQATYEVIENKRDISGAKGVDPVIFLHDSQTFHSPP